MADDKTELAQDRTELAEDRTLLANERTFAGWIRTGLSAVGIGLGFHALFSMMEPGWVPRAIATAFMLVGAFIFFAAETRARGVTGRLDPDRVAIFGPLNLKLITWAMILTTGMLIAALWLLQIKPQP